MEINALGSQPQQEQQSQTQLQQQPLPVAEGAVVAEEAVLESEEQSEKAMPKRRQLAKVKPRQLISFNTRSQSVDDIQKRHHDNDMLKLSYRISAKETVDIQKNINFAIQKVASQKWLDKKFGNLNMEHFVPKTISKTVKVNAKNVYKTIVARSAILHTHLKNAIKQKVSSRCIEDYFYNEANLLNLHENKLETAKEYFSVFKLKEKAAFDKATTIKEMDLGPRILKSVMKTIKDNKKHKNRSKSMNQREITRKISSFNESLNNNAINEKDNDNDNDNQNTFVLKLDGDNGIGELGEERILEKEEEEQAEAEVDLLARNISGPIDMTKRLECSSKRKKDSIEQDDSTNYRQLLLSMPELSKMTTCEMAKHSKENIGYFKRFNFPHEAFTLRLTKVKEELENDRTKHFQKRIFSNEQIDHLIQSKRHLKLNELRKYYYKKIYAEKNFIPKEFKESALPSSSSLPVLQLNKTSYPPNKKMTQTKIIDTSKNNGLKSNKPNISFV